MMDFASDSGNNSIKSSNRCQNNFTNPTNDREIDQEVNEPHMFLLIMYQGSKFSLLISATTLPTNSSHSLGLLDKFLSPKFS